MFVVGNAGGGNGKVGCSGAGVEAVGGADGEIAGGTWESGRGVGAFDSLGMVEVVGVLRD
jgi:hypothetical protein